jgi:hypothetical protein
MHPQKLHTTFADAIAVLDAATGKTQEQRHAENEAALAATRNQPASCAAEAYVRSL